MHTICTLSQGQQPARSSRSVLLVNTYGKTAMTHAESGMRYHLSPQHLVVLTGSDIGEPLCRM